MERSHGLKKGPAAAPALLVRGPARMWGGYLAPWIVESFYALPVPQPR